MIISYARGLVYIIFFSINITISCFAIDDLQYILQQKYTNPQVRWDKIKVKNVDKGNVVKLKLDSNSMLRVHSNTDDITPDMFEVLVSSGSGIYKAAPLNKTNYSKDLILQIDDEPAVIQITLKQLLKLEFFVARYLPPAQFVLYPDKIVPTHNVSARILEFNKYLPKTVDFHQFSFLDNNKELQYNIQGPIRLEITTRYIYEQNAANLNFPYNINIKLNNKLINPAILLAAPDYYDLYLDNRLLSRPDTYQFSLPEGKHKLNLSSALPIIFKLYSAATTTENITNESAPMPSEIKNKMLLSQDKQNKAFGLSINNLAKNFANGRKDNMELKNYGDKISNIFTFYRNLLPVKSNTPYKLSMDYVINNQLMGNKDPNLDYKIDKYEDILLKQLIFAYFIELKLEKKLEFKLPDNIVDSKLRLMIQKENLAKPVKLWVQYDVNPPQMLIFDSKEKSDFSLFKPSTGLRALAEMKPITPHDEKMDTLSGSFTQNHTPGYLKPAGIITLSLPKKTRKISIWSEHDSEQDANNLLIALQYQDSKRYEVPEYLNNTNKKIFLQALKFFDHECETTKDFSSKNFVNYFGDRENNKEVIDIYNSSLDLIKLLHERYLVFKQGFEDVDTSFIKPIAPIVQGNINIKDLKHAKQLLKNKNWVLAINALTKIIENGNLKQWQDAHIERAYALQMSGESYLAERSLKALVLKAQHIATRQAAYNKLMELYKARNYSYGQEGLIAAYITLNDDAAPLQDLTEILVNDDNPKQAMLAANLFSDNVSDEARFMQIKNNQNEIVKQDKSIAIEDKHFWQGLNFAKNGLYKKALSEFSKAKTKGEVWREYLSQGLNIRDKLYSKKKLQTEAVEEWLYWYYNYPGPKYYIDANYLITSFHGATTLYSASRDIYQTAFVAAHDKPVSIQVLGPSKLKIIARPIFKTTSSLQAKNSFAIIQMNQKPYFLKLSNSVNSNPFTIMGKPNAKLGIEQIFETELPYGMHEISIMPQAQEQEIITRFMIQRPIVLFPVLPMPTPKSLYAITNGTVTIEQNNINQEKMPGDIAYEITQILQEYQQSLSTSLLVTGSRLCERHRGIYNIDRLCKGFEILSRAKPILTLDRNTEVIIKELNKNWEPDNVNLDIRQDIITGEDKDSFVLSGNNTAIINFTNENQTMVKIKASMLKLVTKNPQNAILAYKIDDQEINKIVLQDSGNEIEQEFIVDKGKHSVRIFLIDPIQETFVKFELAEKYNDTWNKVDIKQKRKYFVVTKDKPAELTILAPAYIAVHKFIDEDSELVRNYYFKQGKNIITLTSERSDRAFYRIYEIIPASPKTAATYIPEPINFGSMKDIGFACNLNKNPDIVNLQDDLSLEGQGSGTFSIMGGIGSTISRSKLLKYSQQSLSYRYFSDVNRLYFYQNILMKELQRGKPSFNFTTRLDYISASLPFDIFGQLNVNTQHFADKQNYMIIKKLGLKSTINTSRKLSHTSIISISDRSMNYDKNGLLKTNSAAIDPDVYSHYARDHKRWINLCYTANSKPRLNNRIWGQIFWQSNEKYLQSDYIKFSLGFDQLINSIILGANISSKHYFKEGSRQHSFNRNNIGLYVAYDHWLNTSNHRLELNARISKIFDSNISSSTTGHKFNKVSAYNYGIGMTLHLGNGRNYRDFRPGEIKFKELRTSKIPSRNEIKE